LKWQVYAEVVGGFSAFTAVLYWIPFVLRIPLIFVWDLILFIFWIALFGLFGKVRLYSFSRSPFEADGRQNRCTFTKTQKATPASSA
jgi:hypothetical protein